MGIKDRHVGLAFTSLNMMVDATDVIAATYRMGKRMGEEKAGIV